MKEKLIEIGQDKINKAEAEFVAKYGNVTRIEKMPVPPMWEEFKSYGMKFYNNQIPTTLDISKNMNLIYLTQGFHGEKIIMATDATQQNYELALDKMVELWREEV